MSRTSDAKLINDLKEETEKGFSEVSAKFQEAGKRLEAVEENFDKLGKAWVNEISYLETQISDLETQIDNLNGHVKVLSEELEHYAEGFKAVFARIEKLESTPVVVVEAAKVVPVESGFVKVVKNEN